jgi:hypothetical protein
MVFDAVATTLKPVDIIEWQLVKEYVYISWELRRERRIIANRLRPVPWLSPKSDCARSESFFGITIATGQEEGQDLAEQIADIRLSRCRTILIRQAAFFDKFAADPQAGQVGSQAVCRYFRENALRTRNGHSGYMTRPFAGVRYFCFLEKTFNAPVA